MKNVNFEDSSINDFAFWGKKGVDELVNVNIEEAAIQIRKLVCKYDRAFSDKFYLNIKENGAQLVKKHVDNLIAIARKTILTNETLEEIKKDNPNIETELKAVLADFEKDHFDDLYVFQDFINCYPSFSSQHFYTKENKFGSLFHLQEGICDVIFYLKEWLGLDEEDNIFGDEYERAEQLNEIYEENGKEIDSFNSDWSEEPEEWDPDPYLDLCVTERIWG